MSSIGSNSRTPADTSAIIIGREHTFVHEIGDMLTAISQKRSLGPDFCDGCRCQQVLDVASRSLQRIQLVGKESVIIMIPHAMIRYYNRRIRPLTAGPDN